jgi:hypothetical protein
MKIKHVYGEEGRTWAQKYEQSSGSDMTSKTCSIHSNITSMKIISIPRSVRPLCVDHDKLPAHRFRPRPQYS